MFKDQVIFDGKCGFCNRTVMFLAKKDVENKFVFVSNESEKGKKILASHQLFKEIIDDSIIVITKDDDAYFRSEAFMFFFKEIAKLRIYYRLLRLVPMKNLCYRLIAKIRRKLPVKNTCEFITDTNFSKKFIH
ncbi:thiol-disulfide oxidoreductase DCC family protein [Sungkyunkwania multivorans]|uniref:Thiol-disulfide oxidoreductase DCC family protein n=1 Tax=Sungkyunkwania multivorans TaxID=1173618 RepID=A0ABW3D2Y4_9FLAO